MTEIGAARYRGGELIGTFRTFVRPDDEVPPFVTGLTGITNAMVACQWPSGSPHPWPDDFPGDGHVSPQVWP